MTHRPMRLSVNVDHVATLRNARGGAFPCPVEAARTVMEAGADGVTVHLREDRRHIRDRDVERIAAEVGTRLNLEMAATGEMVGIACRLRPPACCLVPEKRQELTTEGGLDVLRAGAGLAEAVRRLAGAGIEVSIFLEADARADRGARADRRPGDRTAHRRLCRCRRRRPPARIWRGSRRCRGGGGGRAALPCRARPRLRDDGAVAAIPEVEEVSIGHFLIGQACSRACPR